MLLRSSISGTKKFLQKTMENLKSFISGGVTYQRLPKTPPFHPFSCGRSDTHVDIESGYKDLDNFYTDFTQHWGSHKSKGKSKGGKKMGDSETKQTHETKTPARTPEIKQLYPETTEPTKTQQTKHEKVTNLAKREVPKSKNNVSMERGREKENDSNSKRSREKRVGYMEQRLKEMEMMDKGNVDYKMDIEEVLHYYSRLTCPAYLDIIDNYFMQMYTEFFGTNAFVYQSR